MDPRKFRQQSPPTRVGGRALPISITKADTGREIVARRPGMSILGPRKPQSMQQVGNQQASPRGAQAQLPGHGMVPAKPQTMIGPMYQQQGPAREQARVVSPKGLLGGRPDPRTGQTLSGIGGPQKVPQTGHTIQGQLFRVSPSGQSKAPYMGSERGELGGIYGRPDKGKRPTTQEPWSPDPEHKWGGPDQKPLPGSKFLSGGHPGVLNAYLAGQSQGGATMSYLGGPAIARLHIGRAVSGLHGLLNQKTPHAFESQRMGRESLLQRQQMLRRMSGEGGGVVTRGGMPGSRNVGAGGFGMGMSTPGFRRSLPVEGQAIMVRSGIKRIKNG